MSAAEVMKELELTTCKDRWTHVQACSAKTGEGLQEGIKALLEQVCFLVQTRTHTKAEGRTDETHFAHIAHPARSLTRIHTDAASHPTQRR